MHINVRCANENENTFSIFLCLVSYQGKIFEEGKKNCQLDFINLMEKSNFIFGL